MNTITVECELRAIKWQLETTNTLLERIDSRLRDEIEREAREARRREQARLDRLVWYFCASTICGALAVLFALT